MSHRVTTSSRLEFPGNPSVLCPSRCIGLYIANHRLACVPVLMRYALALYLSLAGVVDPSCIVQDPILCAASWSFEPKRSLISTWNSNGATTRPLCTGNRLTQGACPPYHGNRITCLHFIQSDSILGSPTTRRAPLNACQGLLSVLPYGDRHDRLCFLHLNML